jgi:uncharacterized protein YciI
LSPIPNGSNLFVIDIQYMAPFEQIDPLIESHLAFLDKNYVAKNFLVSGAKIPRSGGVIIAVATSKEAVELILQEDPFCIHNVALFTITEFSPTKAAAGLKS